MNTKELIKKFGGQTALSKMLGIRQSAIAYWVNKNSVPSKWHKDLLSIAEKNGVDILASDLLTVDLNVSGGAIENNMANSQSYFDDAEKSSPSFNEISNGAQQFMFYASENGSTSVQVLLGDETVWANQRGMADIFDVTVSTISEHLQNIFKSNELDSSTTVRKIRIVVDSGKEDWVQFYNLDAIISVGYRVNSHKATQFRRWATSILKEYLIKGFALDDERLKQGNQLFGKDYFDELLQRIRKIRNSERMFWQKITDLYSQCSIDYDKDSPITQNFFAQIQNKFHYAIHHHTAAELIKIRADSSKPNMGLVSFKNMNKDGLILKSDIPIGKNYLELSELDELERLVENYLGTAELFARRKILMTMKDWVKKIDEFLKFNAYDVLDGFGKVSSENAKKHALIEYEKYTLKHDKEFKSDFDKIIDNVKLRKKLPK